MCTTRMERPIYIRYFDSFIIENMHIYDMDRPDGDNDYLFYVRLLWPI